MNTKRLVATSISILTIGSALSVFGQSTVYEQSRSGGTTGGANNPDFTLNGFSSTLSANKSTAPGLPAGSSSSRIASTSIAAGPGTNFVVSPNKTTAGQLVNGTRYAVAVTFGSTGGNETTDLVVTTSDTQTSGNDTFAGTSACFQRGNGYNVWIPVGNVTINGSLPTFTFTYLSGASARWYVDSLQFTPLPPSPQAQYWNTGSPGGTGNWDLTSMNWNSAPDGSGTQSAFTQSDVATFNGASGTVTISDSVNGVTTDGGLEFDTSGYLVTGGPLTLGSGPTFGTNIAVVGAGATATINSVINGANGLCNAGTGTLNLGAAENVTGTVTLSAGKLHLQPGVNQTFTSLGGTAALAIGANTLTVGDSTTFTYSGVLSDGGSASPGTLIKAGSGMMTLGGANTFYGTTIVNGGTLGVSADDNLGTAPSTLVANQLTLNGNGATLFPSGAITFNAKRGFTLAGSNTLTMPHAIEVTLNNPITGSGSLYFPSGWPDFNVSNSFTGDLVFNLSNNISARLNADHSAGSGTIRIAPQTASGTPFTLRNNGASIVSTLTNNIVFDETVSGAQSYNFDTGSGNSVFTLSGNISGHASGGVNLNDNSNGQGLLILSGDNSGFSGEFNLEGSTLLLGSKTALGTGPFLVTVSVTPNNYYRLESSLPLTGNNAITNPVGLAVGSGFVIQGSNPIEFSGPTLLGTSVNVEVDDTAPAIFSGSISDSNDGFGLTLTSTNSGVLELTGSNSFTGNTFINSGTLIAGGTNSIPGGLFVNGGNLQINSATALAPAAGLTFNGSGFVNLNFHGYLAISSLNVNGAVQGYGAYGASTNNPGGVFTGTGTLVIAPAFAISSQYLDSNSHLVVCWQSTPGQAYDVLTNLNIGATANWNAINPSPITAADTTTCYTLPGGNTNVFVIIRANNP